jgi:hypothetical protein
MNNKKDIYSKYRIIACREPKKGEFYLRPTGKKDERVVMQANVDFKKHMYIILGEK